MTQFRIFLKYNQAKEKVSLLFPLKYQGKSLKGLSAATMPAGEDITIKGTVID